MMHNVFFLQVLHRASAVVCSVHSNVLILYSRSWIPGKSE